jgi:hypothetical protein
MIANELVVGQTEIAGLVPAGRTQRLMIVIVVVPAETAAGVGCEPVEVEVEAEAVAHWALEKLLAECWTMEVQVA